MDSWAQREALFTRQPQPDWDHTRVLDGFARTLHHPTDETHEMWVDHDLEELMHMDPVVHSLTQAP